MFLFGCAPCCCAKGENDRNVKAIVADDPEWDPVTGAVAEEAADLQAENEAEQHAAAMAAPKVVGLTKGVEEDAATVEGAATGGQSPPSEQPGAGSIFSVTLQKPKETDWGIDIFDDGEMFEITRIRGEETASAIHNSSAPAEERLRPGDMIISINGVSGDTPRMMSEWRLKPKVTCEIARPKSFVVHINKTGPLGIDVIHAHREIGCSLAVDRILEGPFTKWNDEHPDQQVERLDRIIAVDGIQGTPDELKQALKNRQGMITLTFSKIAR